MTSSSLEANSSKWILGIDSATSETEACLYQQSSGAYFECKSARSKGEQDNLSSVLRKLLSKANTVVSCIGGIVVGSGPGSFTGLRISYSFAKGLAQGLKIPLLEESSLTAWASSFSESAPAKGLIIAALDAGRGEAFCAVWEGQEPLWEPKIVPWNELLPFCLNSRRLSSPAISFITPMEQQLHLGDLTALTEVTIRNPSSVALNLIKLRLASFQTVNTLALTQLSAMSPNYLRAVAAKTIAERGI